jgi:hypothetical protein
MNALFANLHFAAVVLKLGYGLRDSLTAETAWLSMTHNYFYVLSGLWTELREFRILHHMTRCKPFNAVLKRAMMDEVRRPLDAVDLSRASLVSSTASSGSELSEPSDPFRSDTELGSEDSGNQSDSKMPAEVEVTQEASGEKENQQKRVQREIGVNVDQIGFSDAASYLVDQTKELKVRVPPRRFEQPICPCLRRDVGPVLDRCWATLFKISKLPFYENDVTHHRILNSLYALITGMNDPPLRFGEHWIALGFRGKDPASELRSAGMLGFLIPLHFFANYKKLGQHFIETSRLPDQEFPLMTLVIGFVSTTLEAAGTTNLLKESQKEGVIWTNLVRFFAGMVQTVVNTWGPQKCDLQHHFWKFDDIARGAKSRPKLALQIGKAAEERELPDSDTVTPVTNDNGN